MYTLIELRARLRAADDTVALTSANIQRILQTAEWLLAAEPSARLASQEQLRRLAGFASKVVRFYWAQVLEARDRLRHQYDTFMESAGPLISMAGGERQFVQLVDDIINVEALDIDLSPEATSLELPPTIMDAMINNLERKWLPPYVLKSVDDDRRLLIGVRRQVQQLVKTDPDRQDADIAKWASRVLVRLCGASCAY